MVGKKDESKAVGMSKGGRNTKIHTLVDGLSNPLAFLLSPGNDHDSRHAIPLLGQIKIDGSNILGDKAYGAKAIRDYIDLQNAAYTIPPKSDVSEPWDVDSIEIFSISASELKTAMMASNIHSCFNWR